MANKNFPRGLQVYGPLFRAMEYTLSTGYAQDLFIGDPVVANGTGRDVVIATAGTGNKILGAIIAIYDLNKVPLAYWPSGNTGVGYVLVANHPNQLFVCQDDGTTSFGINGANGNVNLVSGSGSTVFYRSGWQLNHSNTPGNTAGDQIRLVRPSDRPDVDVTLANTDWICYINNHQALQGIVGAGI